MEESRPGRQLDTQIAHLVFGTPIDELNRMDEVPRYSREPALAWAAVDRLKSGMQLGCTCWRDETGDGRVSYDCWISVGDEHGLRVTDFRECGHGEALAICRTLLDVLRANPAELTA